METIVQQFIKAFGWSILNSLWQSAIIYGVLFLIIFGLPKLAAKYKHNLSFGAIVLMFAGFCYSFLKQISLNTPQQPVLTGNQNVLVYQYFNYTDSSFSAKAEHYFPLVVSFYLIGILLQLYVIAKGYHQISKLRKNNIAAIPENWNVIFENVVQRLKIRKMVEFKLSSIVNVPLVIGYLKPIVLFPLALVNQLDEDQVEAILIHELSHIRRNDFLLNLIKTAIETLLFYNPFVWLAGRFIHIEREHACDDLVLQITGKPLNYAHALLKLELLKDKSSPAYALAATGKTQNLYQRIKRITNMKTNYLNAKQQMAALTLGVACLCSIAWINPTEKKKEQLKISQHQLIVQPDVYNQINNYQDTTKKRKLKIVTVDANGKRTEYNSIQDMPDSLRKDFYKDQFFPGNTFNIGIDSNFIFKDSIFKAKIFNEFNSPEAQEKWRKYGEDIAKQYTSPQAQAKWKKFGEDIAKEYASPQAQAKWKKFGEDIAKAYASPEAQAKWKKFGEDIAKEYGSPEAQAKWRKLGEEISASVNTPEFKAQLADLSAKARLNRQLNLDSLKDLHYLGLSSPERNFLLLNDEVNGHVKQMAEYKKLKDKFDKDVKALQEKAAKEERKSSTKN